MSADKKNSNNGNPIEAIAAELGNGISFLGTKLVEAMANLIKNGIDALVKKSTTSKKVSPAINIKKGFRK